MKSNAVFKRAFNDTIDFLSSFQSAEPLPSESRLCAHLGVSRTTVRRVFLLLEEKGFVTGSGRIRMLTNRDLGDVRFPETETLSKSAQLEKKFMEWMQTEAARPGMAISESDLARQFEVATTMIREFLNRFQHFGLIDKGRNGKWYLKGFTTEFALELFEIREMFELRSAHAFGALPDHSAQWRQLEAIRVDHLALKRTISEKYRDFSDLDDRFHRLINSAASNRFIDDFYDIISLIFHYHYQWNKHDEKARNEVAIMEHLAYIDALTSGNQAGIEKACRLHLASAKKTLISSMLSNSAS